MSSSLLRSARFLPLFLTQALGALNDNLFKNALVVLAVFRSAENGAALAAAAGGLFILPYLLFSSVAGQAADRFDKARLLRISKLAELGLMALAAIAFLADSIPGLFAVLAGLGVQATFFGPLKYGLLPERLAPAELLRGNALIEAGTFGAILLGTIVGGLLIGLEAGRAVVAVVGVAVALAGLLTAWAVPPGRPASPGLRVEANIAAATLYLLGVARRNRAVWVGALGISWFWTMGATDLALFPVLAKTVFHADNRVVTLLLTMFVGGIGAGSMLAGRRGGLRSVVPALLLLGLFTLAFACLTASSAAAGWTAPVAMLVSPAGLLALACLLGAAAAGGMFSVPLYALIQARAEPGQRAQMIAANNVLNALFMVAGAAAVAALAAFGMGAAAILTLAAALNLPVALLIRRALPEYGASPIASLEQAGP